MLLLALGCLSDGPVFGLSRAGEDPRHLVFNNATEPEWLDPTQATGHPDGRIIGELFDGLTEYDPVDLSPRPSLAESWDVHPDGRGYTFHLRNDAQWSDGTPITAQDFLYSWEHVLNPAYLGRYAQQLYMLERAEAYNQSRVWVLSEDHEGLAAGTHLGGTRSGFVVLDEDVDVAGGVLSEGSVLALVEGRPSAVRYREACPDSADLPALQSCKGEPRIVELAEGSYSETWPAANQRVLREGIALKNDDGERIGELRKGDEVLWVDERGTDRKVYLPREDWTGWVPANALEDPREGWMEAVELPPIDWDGSLEDPEDTGEVGAEYWSGVVPLDKLVTRPEVIGARAIDDHTLEVRLHGVAPYFLQLTSHTTLRAIPRQAWETHGPRWTRPDNIITSGPFLLDLHKVRDRFELSANPEWWGADELAFDRVTAFSIDNLHTSVNLYRAGYTDYVVANDIPAEFIPILQDKEDFHVSPGLSVYVYRMNTDKPPLDDARVRRALAMAIDKRDIVKVLKAGQIPATHIVPPGLPGYDGPEGPAFDPDAARALLAEAGFPGGEGFPELNILYNTSESHKLVAAVIQEQWKEHLGIQIQLENREWKTYLKTVTSQDYDIARGGWIGDYLDPTTFLDLWVAGGGNNNTGWENQGYDDLLSQASAEADPETRAQLLREAEAILNEEMPFIPMYWYVWAELVQPGVRGSSPNLLDQHPIRFMSIER